MKTLSEGAIRAANDLSNAGRLHRQPATHQEIQRAAEMIEAAFQPDGRHDLIRALIEIDSTLTGSLPITLKVKQIASAALRQAGLTHWGDQPCAEVHTGPPCAAAQFIKS